MQKAAEAHISNSARPCAQRRLLVRLMLACVALLSVSPLSAFAQERPAQQKAAEASSDFRGPVLPDAAPASSDLPAGREMGFVGPPTEAQAEAEALLLAQEEAALSPSDTEKDPGLGNLPPVKPDPAIAPIITEPPPVKLTREERREVVLKTLLGLIAVLALAYLGGHPKVLELEERLGVSQVITAGLPFIVLGAIATLPSVGIVTGPVLSDISPLLRIGLGWLGFVIGFRFDARLLTGLGSSTARYVAMGTLFPFLGVVTVSALILLGAGESIEQSLRNPVFLRDALILGTAGSMTATSATLLLPKQSGPEARERVSRVIQLEELAGIVGLAIVGAYFRPQSADISWQIPGTAWLLLTVGIGATMGTLIFAMFGRDWKGPELTVLLLGSIAFAAGVAGQLYLSSLVICFIAAVLLVNFPGVHREHIRSVLEQLERPIYLLFLFVVGSLWHASSWTGWLLLPAFVLARLFGKWLGSSVAAKGLEVDLDPRERRSLVIAPLGSLAVAIVVSAQLLYPGGYISDIVIAVVGGAVLTEGLVQFFRRVAP